MRTMAATILLGAPAMAGMASPPGPAGLWLNPHNSVVVRAGPCGLKLCGWIVWANGEAQADARDGGVMHLVGTELLQDYTARRAGIWAGTVYVPDMGRRFSSEIDELAPDKLKIKGCILGGLICKSQIWTRVEHFPND